MFRLCGGEEFAPRFFGKDANGVNALERREHGGAVGFGFTGRASPFIVALNHPPFRPTSSGVAEMARGGQVGHVSGVEQIETALVTTRSFPLARSSARQAGRFSHAMILSRKFRGGLWASLPSGAASRLSAVSAARR